MDIMSSEERRRRMSGVRSKGNRSTEWKFRSALIRKGIRGWEMHARWLPGIPDFLFPKLRVAIFIDGCFWHGCPYCNRPLPQANRAYWSSKLKFNIAQAKHVNRVLLKKGIKVIRVWEHEVRKTQSIDFLLSKLFSRHKRPKTQS